MKDNAKIIIKGAGVLLVAVILIFSATTVTANTKENMKLDFNNEKPLTINQEILFEDSFEDYEDWLTDFPPWTTIDVDGQPTFGHTGCDFPLEGQAYAFGIFNPASCDPPQTEEALQPHTGEKMVVCWAVDVTFQNDDWLITPLIDANDFDVVTFWAHSYSDQYNLERFEVGVSTTDTDPASFTIISESPYEEPPLEWTQYSYNLDDFDDQSIYIAIHGISYDSWALMVDDFQVIKDEPKPAICCNGELTFTDVDLGEELTGEFEVCNCGEEGSFLNWEFLSAPSWGDSWEIDPASGQGLAKDECVTITVTFDAPDEAGEEFTGKINMTNSDDPSNICQIDILVTTPRNIQTTNTFFARLIEKFPNAFPLLRQLIGL